MDDLATFVDRYGLFAVIALLTVINVWRYVIPELVQYWKQRQLDQQEHRQEGDRVEWQIRQSERFSTMHHEATRDERYAILTDRIYDQLDQANDFIRSEVKYKMDEIDSRLILLETRLSLLVQVMESVYDKDTEKHNEAESDSSTRGGD